jgi:DNA-binding NarL/FixJ family response regulator
MPLRKPNGKSVDLPGKTCTENQPARGRLPLTKPLTTTGNQSRPKCLTKTKILVVHFIPLLCFGVAQMLSAADDFDVCDTTDDARSARRLFERHQPRVAIIGPALRGGDGIQLIKQLHKMDRDAAILMLSAIEEPQFIQRAWRAGALGFLRIWDAHLELVPALKAICEGHRYVSHALTQAMYDYWSTGKSGRSKIDSLSDREREAFLLIGKGATLREAANEMGVSDKSIQTYLKRAKEKFGLQSNAQLRAKAARAAMKRAWKRMELTVVESAA